MLSTRPGAEEAGAACTASIAIQTLAPLRAQRNSDRPSPDARSSKPSPASTLSTAWPPSLALQASAASAQTKRSQRKRSKSAFLTVPEGPTSLATSRARSSERPPSSPAASGDFASHCAKASAPQALPPAMALKSSPAELPAARALPRRAQAAACACVEARSADLSSARSGCAAAVAFSTSSRRSLMLALASCTSFCATKRCSRSVHCFDSFASSTWHCVSRDWNLAKSAVIAPRDASLEFLASCARWARNFLASATAACASCSTCPISMHTACAW
mmetsp:Transcript_18120/g.51637  ORF Transcript_18120/g.51637 Transcript_18120/m.51637 type:complete len:276 (+) Transcript_18120:985-1812(+)